MDEAPTGGQDPALVAVHGRDSTHGAGHSVLANQAESTGVGNPAPVDPTGKYVDYQ